jgi:hypothetical protein
MLTAADRLLDVAMGVIHDRTKVANIDPAPALGAADVTVCRFGSGPPVSFIKIFAAGNRPHRKASFIRAIAGSN